MTLAKLEERGINSHAEAVHELKKMNEELYFYTPHHRITIKGNLHINQSFDSYDMSKAPLICPKINSPKSMAL